MKGKKLKESFHTIKLSDDKKATILSNIYKKNNQAAISKGNFTTKFNFKTIVLAASLMLVVGVIITQKSDSTDSLVPTGSPMVGHSDPIENTSIDLDSLETELDAVNIQNHTTTSTFAAVTEIDELTFLIDALAEVTPREMTDADYEEVGLSQAQGHSFTLRFVMKSGDFSIIRVLTNLNTIYFNDAYHYVDKEVSEFILDIVANSDDLTSINNPAAY